MVLLIDVNVALDYMLVREPRYSFAGQIIMACKEGKIEGYIAFHTVSILWYTLRKTSIEKRRQQLLDLCKCVKVTGASHEEVISAIQDEAFPDFEDCLQERCAKSIGADYIVTENAKDFVNSSIPVLTSAEMAKMLEEI